MAFVEAYARSERGFYRCGKFWPSTGARFEVTPDELTRITQEPNLVVTGIGESGEVLDRARQKIVEAELAYRRAVEEAKELTLAVAEPKAGAGKEPVATSKSDSKTTK